MRFVTFDLHSCRIRSATLGPADSHLQDLRPGEKVGDAGEFQLEGARENYVFVPDEGQSPDTVILKGSVQRKPKEKWDLQAEAKEEARRRGMQRCHSLDMADVDHIDVYLLIPAYFVWLSKEPHSYSFCTDNIPLTVSITRVDKIKNYVAIGGGIQNLDLRQSLIKFTLTGKEEFLVNAISAFLKKSGPGFEVFTSGILQSECLKFSVRLANRLIECYRVGYDDPRARTIGFADALSCNILVTLRDGHTCHYQTENPSERETQLSPMNGERQDELSQAERTMQTLLTRSSLPFLEAAIASLKCAHLYGQYRECVVWAGTIISNIVEDILLNNLPTTSAEYRSLKNNPDKVRGATKRSSYFKMATGQTLKDYLDRITNAYSEGNQSEYWVNLSTHVDRVLVGRNLLLHKRKSIKQRDADDAFYTCMNFLHAIYRKVPYSNLYSRDINLRLSERFL